MNLPRVSDGLITRLEFGLLLVVAGLLIALYLESCGDRGTPELQVAHEATIAAERIVAQQAVLFKHDTVERAIAVGDYRQARAGLVITDTVQVKATFLKADVALAKDSTALASATALVVAHGNLEAKLRAELAIARRPPPRLGFAVDGLYDPIAKAPNLTLDATVRITDRVSLLARRDQRFAVGEAPRYYLGGHISF